MKRSDTQKRFTRSFTLTATEKNEREFEISVSSEEPCKRDGFVEVLGHKSAEVDLSFFASGNAPVLMNHSGTEQIGVVQSAWLENNRLKALIKISQNRTDVLSDIRDGILKNVSVGYTVTRQIEKSNRIKVVRWKPLEASIVSIPADESVGINRSLLLEQEVFMDPEEIQLNDERKRAGEEERLRCREILAMGRRFQCEESADKAIAEGIALDSFRQSVLNQIEERQKRQAAEVITKVEEDIHEPGREFSILRAAQALLTNDFTHAGYERRVSEHLGKMYNQQNKNGGILVPMNLRMGQIQHRTTQVAGTPAAGGYLVGTDHRPDLFIDALRAQTVLSVVGARFMTGLVGNVDIPALLTGVAFEHVAENNAATEGAPVWGQVTLAPKTITANIPLSRRLLIQSSPDVEQILRQDMSLGSAIAIEKAAYKGGGSNQPKGIIETTGVNGTPFATANDPTYEELVWMQTKVDTNNAMMGSLATITNPTAYGKMRVKKVDSGSGLFLVKDGMAADHRIYSTNCMEAGYTIFGNWAELMIGQFGAMEIVSVRSATTGGLTLGIFIDYDVAVRHPKGFCIAKAGQTSL